ncbi:neuronal acetylcholine receptor subunit alpha-7 [Plakobranchus ocellatus]|uniref:Neuronal acetylcholine receptor subunit alpha-7 n=1 Tax=Plakobranchus ocellatus TaxID=259542 RepID=A0AAV3XXC4_9GAST|nr:neuronal acetylcholine receptor subunit alpha-7 [Plakobranchus ocellatus]
MCDLKCRFCMSLAVVMFMAVTSSRGNRDMSRLLAFLFKDYDPVVWPRLNSMAAVEVRVGIGIFDVVSLDTKDQTLHVNGYLSTIWKDEYLQWNSSDYGNITSMVLTQNYVWTPDLTLSRSIDANIFLGSSQTNLLLHSDGTVSWQPSFNSFFTCKVDVSKFPLDVNICPIVVGSWMHSNSLINLSTTNPHTLLEPDITNGEFDIAVEEPLKVSLPYDGLLYDMIHFRLKLSRKPTHTFLSLLLPMFVIGLLSPISFLVPANNTDKVSLSLDILLSTAVCIGVVSGNLPERSDEISSIAVYVVSLLVLAFFGVLGNTVILLVHQYEEAHPSYTELAPPTSDNINCKLTKPGAENVSSHAWNHRPHQNGGNDLLDRGDTTEEPSYRPDGQPAVRLRTPTSRAERLNRLFFCMNISGLVLSFAAVLLQIAM